MSQETERALHELRVEIAAQRLVTRSLIAFLILQHKAPLGEMVGALAEATDRMTSPIADLDPQIQREACVLVERRMDGMISDLGPLLFPDLVKSRSAA